MKKISFLLMIITIMTLSMSSCKKPKACEDNNTGTITVYNTSYENIWVDVTYSNQSLNQEVKLHPGEYKEYTMKVGPVIVWGTTEDLYYWDQWYNDDMYVYECEDRTYSWSKKKSAEVTVEK